MSTFAALRNALFAHLENHLRGLDTPERVEALMSYCQGISLEFPRKSLASLAKRVAPDNVEGQRQRMHRALHRGRFSKDDIFGRLQETVWKSGSGLSSFCIDDTGFAKKGELSVGVHRQYSGTLGKIGNCQVAVSLHVALDAGSVCTDAQLYLPEAWATDQSRRLKAGVPTDIQFQSKWQLAISMLQRAVEGGAPSLPVLADAGYGDSRDFRDAVRALGLHYCVGISSNTNVWPVGSTPIVPPKTGRGGRPWRRAVDPSGAKPVRVSSIAEQAYNDGLFRNVCWRNGTKGPLRASFYAVRIQSAERETKKMPPSKMQWLLMERDPCQKSGFKYYFCSVPQATSLKRLAFLAKSRWRIERDYQDMKQHLGLAKYEGRHWGGFHRHFAMVALMHAFLILYKEDFSPRGEATMDATTISPRCGACVDLLAWKVPNMREAV